MIYVVTGDGPRCGSAMMMRALAAGGIPIMHNPDQDVQAEVNKDEEYHPNEDGLFELSMGIMTAPGFPDDSFEGHCIKVFPPPWMPLTHLLQKPGRHYRVVWMHRDFQARVKSFNEFHSRSGGLYITESPHGNALMMLRDMAAEASLHFVSSRPDMTVARVEYESVLEYPKRTFEQLKELGWEIDPLESAKVPDKSRKRF